MKNLAIQIRAALQPKQIFLILLSLGFIGLHAQDTIIPPGSSVIKLSTNQYLYLEGPVWYNDSVLLFVDDGMPGTGSDIYKYDPASLQFIKWPSNSTHCTGLTCDKDGYLIGASSNVIMMNEAGQVIKTMASLYNGKHFDNPNDLIADAKGGVYFSDPDFFVTNPPQDKTAVYYIDSTGNVIRVIDDVDEPNGLVLSPNGTKLYVDDGNSKYVYSWDVAPDGTVSGKITLAELQTVSGDIAESDGMAIDIHGNIYVATGKGIQVFSPEGEAIATIVVPGKPSNCDFGGGDFKTLYITAHHNVGSNYVSNLYSISLTYPGYAVSRSTSPNGIGTIPSKSLVEMYPNPAGDNLYIQNYSGKINSIEILNLDGRTEFISSKKTEESGIEINIQNLKPGMYLLRIVYNEGIITRKFVKE
jgi:gluconolactonase